MTREFWTSGLGMPSEVAKQAAAAEAAGWDGFAIPYASVMAADPFVCLTVAAAATSTIQLGTWVATPASHTPASQAGSIKTVQVESGGRAVLGLGRGDSAHAYIGMSPAPPAFFERYVSRLRNYLQDTPQPFDLDLDGGNHFRPIDRLKLKQVPEDARFGRGMRGITPVPLDIVGTGPKVLGIAARHADTASLAVGAEPARVEWALGVVRGAREEASVTRPTSIGCWVPLAVTEDREEGHRLLSGVVASMARFTAMHGRANDSVSDRDRTVYEQIHDAYEMHAHFQEGSPQSRKLTTEFTERFAVIGPPDECVRRVRALMELGIDRFRITSPTPDRFASEVLPTLK